MYTSTHRNHVRTFCSRLLSAGFKAVSSPPLLPGASPPSGLDPEETDAAPEFPLSVLLFSFCVGFDNSFICITSVRGIYTDVMIFRYEGLEHRSLGFL